MITVIKSKGKQYLLCYCNSFSLPIIHDSSIEIMFQITFYKSLNIFIVNYYFNTLKNTFLKNHSRKRRRPPDSLRSWFAGCGPVEYEHKDCPSS